MSGWVGGWVDGWIDGWMDGWMDGWIDGQTDRSGRRAGGRAGRQIDGHGLYIRFSYVIKELPSRKCDTHNNNVVSRDKINIF